MKTTDNPYASDALAAEKLVQSWGLNLHIDPFAIADQFKIAVAAKPASRALSRSLLNRER